MKSNTNMRLGKPSLFKQIAKNYSCYLFMLPFAVVFILFTVVPVITAIGFSFTDFNVLEKPEWVGWHNYRQLFTGDDLFLDALKNTLVIAAIVGPAGYIMSFVFAWCINDLPPFFRAVLTLMFYAPTLSNIYAIWKIIFSSDDYGIMNSYLLDWGIIDIPIKWLQDSDFILPVVVIILLWSSLGTSFLSFIAGLQSVDRTLYEAAAVDGIHNRFQELWYITLPSMKPQLMFGAIMSISTSFGVGDAITAVFGFPSPSYAAHTMAHHIQDYGFTRFQMGYACAIAVILFVIMVSTNQIIQRMLKNVGK